MSQAATAITANERADVADYLIDLLLDVDVPDLTVSDLITGSIVDQELVAWFVESELGHPDYKGHEVIGMVDICRWLAAYAWSEFIEYGHHLHSEWQRSTGSDRAKCSDLMGRHELVRMTYDPE